MCSVLGDADDGGRLTLQAIYVGQLPIPNASESDQKQIAALVRKCLDSEGIGCEGWEREIDRRVAMLYGIDLPFKQESTVAKRGIASRAAKGTS